MSDETFNPILDEAVMDEVFRWKRELHFRVMAVGLKVEEEQVVHVLFDNFIYVMANPIVRSEPVYNHDGQQTGVLPIRNFHLNYQPMIAVDYDDAPEEYRSWIPPELAGGKVSVPNPVPVKMGPVTLPQLVVKLDLSGKLVKDGATSISHGGQSNE